MPDGVAVISFCLELVCLSFLIFHLYFGNFGTRKLRRLEEADGSAAGSCFLVLTML